MKIIMKIISLGTHGIAIICLVFTLGCQTVPTKVSKFTQYQTTLNSAKTQQDLDNSKEFLLQYIEEALPGSTQRRSGSRIMAYQLLLGKFGYFNEKDFIYWANVNGSEPDFKYVLEQIPKIRSAYEVNPTKVNSVYQTMLRNCPEREFKIKNLNEDEDNLALYFLGVNECIGSKLLFSYEARTAYADFLDVAGVRENNSEKILGFRLYKENMSDYSQLSQLHAKSLLNAKLQVFTFSANFENPKAMGNINNEHYKKSLEILEKLNSNNQSDWLKALKMTDEIVLDEKLAEKQKSYLLYSVVLSAYLKENYSDFHTYAHKLINGNYLTTDELNSVEKIRALVMLDNDEYQQGLIYIDAALLRLKPQN